VAVGRLARMPLLRNEDVVIWCCPNAHLYQIIEFTVGDPEPLAKFCGKCGNPYVKRCPNKTCPHRNYHPSDQYNNVHAACGTKIPWAEARNASVIVGPGFQSKLVGTGTYMGPQKLGSSSAAELTPQEREDLIAPSSGRLAVEPRRTVVFAGPGTGKSFALIRYLLQAGVAIDRPPRKVVRAVLRFFADRGEVVGRGADKGLEDAATFLVKTVIIVGVITAFGVCGIRLALGT